MLQFASSPRAWNQPFRPEDHDRNKNDAKDQVANIAEGKTRYDIGNTIVNRVEYIVRIGSQAIEVCEDKHVDRIDRDCSNDHSGDTAYTANDYHCEVDHRIAEAETIRRDTPKFGCVKGPRDSREECAGCKGEQFGTDEIDTRRFGGNFILTDSDPGTAQPRVAQANIDKDGDGDQHENQVIVWC